MESKPSGAASTSENKPPIFEANGPSSSPKTTQAPDARYPSYIRRDSARTDEQQREEGYDGDRVRLLVGRSERWMNELARAQQYAVRDVMKRCCVFVLNTKYLTWYTTAESCLGKT